MAFRPRIDVFDLPCGRLPGVFDGLRVLHLSDLHVTKWTRQLDGWKGALGELEPEVVVITGDLGHRSWLWQKSLENVERLLEPLRPRLGTFFILGNHDSAKLGPALAETVDAGGNARTMLRNETVFIEKRGERFEVVRDSEGAGTRGGGGWGGRAGGVDWDSSASADRYGYTDGDAGGKAGRF